VVTKKQLIAGAVCLLSGSLIACDRYMDRRDQVTFGTGDSIAANKAAQIIDPWPVAARTIEHGISGEQAEAALARMRKTSTDKNAPEKTEENKGVAPSFPPAVQLK
jgi:hypothetical protein